MLGIRGLFRGVWGLGWAPTGKSKKSEQGRAGTMNGVGRIAVGRTRKLLGALLALALLVGCGEVVTEGGGPVDDRSATMSIEEAVAAIKQATPNPITPEAVAETFALGGAATDIQREMMEKALVGSVVEWDLVVFNVKLAKDRYELTSQPIQIQSPAPVQLVSVVALIQSQGPEDDALLQKVKTGDPIRIRGLVQGIRLRTIVAIGPGVVVGDVVVGSPASEATPGTGTT